MEKAILKQNRERIVQREVFSNKFKTLTSIAGSNLATCFALFKMAFYDVKSQEALLECKGLKVRPSGKRVKYNAYLDYITAEELKYLNKGLDEILNKVGKENSEFSGFPFIYNEIIEIGKNLRYDFFDEFGILPEAVEPEETSVKQAKKCLAQTHFNNKFTAKKEETITRVELDNVMGRCRMATTNLVVYKREQ